MKKANVHFEIEVDGAKNFTDIMEEIHSTAPDIKILLSPSEKSDFDNLVIAAIEAIQSKNSDLFMKIIRKAYAYPAEGVMQFLTLAAYTKAAKHTVINEALYVANYNEEIIKTLTEYISAKLTKEKDLLKVFSDILLLRLAEDPIVMLMHLHKLIKLREEGKIKIEHVRCPDDVIKIVKFLLGEIEKIFKDSSLDTISKLFDGPINKLKEDNIRMASMVFIRTEYELLLECLENSKKALLEKAQLNRDRIELEKILDDSLSELGDSSSKKEPTPLTPSKEDVSFVEKYITEKPLITKPTLGEEKKEANWAAKVSKSSSATGQGL